MIVEEARRVIRVEAEALLAMAERINGAFEQAVRMILDCTGRVVVSGMGKSGLVGQKIAIASSKPQTTRHVVRGIITEPEGQLVLIDTPGLHRPRTLLGQRLNDLVFEAWAEVDVVGVWLVDNYRPQFAQQINAGGVDALIRSLSERNQSNAASGKT